MAKVSPSENEKWEEFRINDDGSLSLSELKRRFNNVIGLRYRDKNSGSLKAVRICNGYFFAPFRMPWQENIYFCVFDEANDASKKCTSLSEYYSLETFEMIVMGVPGTMTNEDFYRYFSRFGKLNLCEIKKNLTTGRCKGLGLIKFDNFDDQHRCINSELLIGNSVMYLRLPKNNMNKSVCSRRIHVCNITPSITFIDLLEYFNVFGKIREFFMPHGGVRYAFITFEKEDAVFNVFKFAESHRIFGGFVIVERIHSKKDMDEVQHHRPTIDSIVRKMREDGFSNAGSQDESTTRTGTKKIQLPDRWHGPPDFWTGSAPTVPEPIQLINNWDNPPSAVTHSSTIQRDHANYNWECPTTNIYNYDHSNVTKQYGGPSVDPGQQAGGKCYQGQILTNTGEMHSGQYLQYNGMGNNKPCSSNQINEELSVQGMPSEAVADVTIHLLRQCNSQSQKKILAKLLLDMLSDPGNRGQESGTGGL